MTSELKGLGVRLVESELNRRGKNPFKELGLLFTYYNYVKKTNPDLVLTYTIKPNLYGGLSARLTKKQYVANITGVGSAFQNPGFQRAIIVFLYRISLKMASTVFFENQSNAELFVKRKIVPQDKVKVLSGAGVNTEHYFYLDYPTEQRITSFLFVGRIMREKGIEELFAAMRMLINKGIKCQLIIVGAMEENYKDKITQYQKEGWLRYEGFSNDVRRQIKDAHCSVLPSWHEGMSNTNLECASCGRPLITTDIPGCREAVVDHTTGMLCKVKDKEDLYRVMKEFIDLPHSAKMEMGIKGREHMIQSFEKQQVVRETMKYL